MTEYLIEINQNIAYCLNTLVLNNWLEKYVWFFADFPIFFLPIFLLVSWIYFTYKIKDNNKKSDLLNIFFWVTLWILISIIIQKVVHIDRPESIIKPILEHIPDASFPSDHATVSFAFITWLFLAWYKRTFYSFTGFVIIMNLARISWWIHWFFDIIVGAIIWIFSSIFIFKCYKKTNYSKKINDLIIKILNYIKL